MVWRLTALAVGYGFVIQSLLLGLVGTELYASAINQGLPGYELCLHGADQAPTSPSSPADHHLGHCVFCFASTHFNPTIPAQASLQFDGIVHGVAWTPATDWRPRLIPAYSIARPRGPPISV